MGVFKEIAKADGSGTTTFYRLSSEEDTVETTSTDGTSTMIDYNSMLNKPSINDVALVGNKTLEDLGIQPAGDYLTVIPEEYITEDELASSDYATKTYVMEQINNIEHFSREVVEALPVTGKSNVIYLKPKDKTNGDVYNEYIWTGADYELIGTTSPDLTIFYTKEETDAKLDKKVNKIDGKDLSTNDYTTTEKTKLASLNNYDDSELRNAVNALHNYDDTEVRQDIAALEDRATDLETSTSQLEKDIVKKTTLVRLIKAGDKWSWQDIEGNNITFAQAQEMLGHQDTLFVLEDIENDGKFSPLVYVSNDDVIETFFISDDKKVHILNGADSPIDSVMGYFVNYAEAVETVEGLNGLGNMDGEIRRVKATDDFYIYDSIDNKWLPFDKGASIDLTNYLPKDNTIPYAPSTDYNPATKRYVDTEIDALFIPTKVSQLNNDSAFVNKSTTVLENYYTKTNTYTKREVDALLDNASGGGGVTDYNELTSQPSINNVILTGNKTLADLGVQPAGNYLTSVPEEYVTASELSAFGYATTNYVDNNKTIVNDTLTSTSSAEALSANQGRILSNRISTINGPYDYKDGTNMFGWGMTAQDGEDMVANYDMQASEVAGAYIGAKYGWPSRMSFSGYVYGQITYMTQDSGTADDGTDYDEKSMVMNNTWYTYLYNTSTNQVYKTYWGSDYTGGVACFTGDTPVLTTTGLKPIKDIEVGDMVVTANRMIDRIDKKPIVGLINHPETEIYRIHIGEDIIEATGSHPFATKEKGKCNARILEIGMTLRDYLGNEQTITNIEKITTDTIVYEIVVDETHSYFVGNTSVQVYNEPSVFNIKEA